MFLASDFIFNLIRFPIHSKIFSAEKALPKRGKKFSLPSTNVLSYVTRKLKLVEFFFLIHLSGTKFRAIFRWKHEYQLCNFRYEYLRQKLFRQEKMWFVFKHGNLMRFFSERIQRAVHETESQCFRAVNNSRFQSFTCFRFDSRKKYFSEIAFCGVNWWKFNDASRDRRNFWTEERL